MKKNSRFEQVPYSPIGIPGIMQVSECFVSHFTGFFYITREEVSTEKHCEEGVTSTPPLAEFSIQHSAA